MAEDRIDPEPPLRLVHGRGLGRRRRDGMSSEDAGAAGMTTSGLPADASAADQGFDAMAGSPAGSGLAGTATAASQTADIIRKALDAGKPPSRARGYERRLELPLAERPAPPSFREIAEFIELWRLRSQSARPTRPRSGGSWWRLGGRAS